MYNLKLSDTEGNVHKIPFPSNLSELPYHRKIDWDVALEDIAIWAHKCAEDGHENAFFENQGYYCYLLCRAVSGFLGYDLQKVMRFNTADMIDSHGNLLPHVVESDYKAEDIDLESAETTLFQIYQLAKNLVDGYRFKFRTERNFQFQFGGKTWEIPRVVQQLFNKRKVFSRYGTQQAVETLMIKSYLEERVNSKRERLPAEQVANERFSAHLQMIAICVKPVIDGEPQPLPLDPSDFASVVAGRVPEFQEIDTQLAMDIVFFLTTTTLSSNKMFRTVFTSSRPKADIPKK